MNDLLKLSFIIILIIFSIKDTFIINDFLLNIFFLKDSQRYNLRLDDMLIILQNILLLLQSSKNVHKKNGLISALKFIKLVSEVKFFCEL